MPDMKDGHNEELDALFEAFLMMKDREENIKQSLEAADRAKVEMQQLQCNNELLLKQAQEERDEMLKETKKLVIQ